MLTCSYVYFPFHDKCFESILIQHVMPTQTSSSYKTLQVYMTINGCPVIFIIRSQEHAEILKQYSRLLSSVVQHVIYAISLMSGNIDSIACKPYSDTHYSSYLWMY